MADAAQVNNQTTGKMWKKKTFLRKFLVAFEMKFHYMSFFGGWFGQCSNLLMLQVIHM